ncbi:hypothetical protein LTR08_002434 [Meristemomyces frigidus]|nr:hypothetical protein LTR08_002434 [Meristemomyces frigidus]
MISGGPSNALAVLSTIMLAPPVALGGPMSSIARELENDLQAERSCVIREVLRLYLNFRSSIHDRLSSAFAKGEISRHELEANFIQLGCYDTFEMRYAWKMVEKRLRFTRYLSTARNIIESRSNVLKMMLSGKWPAQVPPEVVSIIYEKLAETAIESCKGRVVRVSSETELDNLAMAVVRPSLQNHADLALVVTNIKKQIIVQAAFGSVFDIDQTVPGPGVNTVQMAVFPALRTLAVNIRSLDVTLRIISHVGIVHDNPRHCLLISIELFAFHEQLARIIRGGMPSVRHLTLTIDESYLDDDPLHTSRTLMNRLNTEAITFVGYFDPLISLIRDLGALGQVTDKFYRFSRADGSILKQTSDYRACVAVRRDLILNDGEWQAMHPQHLSKAELEANGRKRLAMRKVEWEGSALQRCLGFPAWFDGVRDVELEECEIIHGKASGKGGSE